MPKKSKIGRDPYIGFALVHKDDNVQNGIRSLIEKINLIKSKKVMKEVATQQAKSAVKERVVDDDLTIFGIGELIGAPRMPLEDLAG